LAAVSILLRPEHQQEENKFEFTQRFLFKYWVNRGVPRLRWMQDPIRSTKRLFPALSLSAGFIGHRETPDHHTWSACNSGSRRSPLVCYHNL